MHPFLPSPVPPLSLPTVTEAPFDRETLLLRLNGDASLAVAMAALMLRELPAQRAAVRNAVLGRDAAGLANSAHTLAGSVGNFLAQDALAAARRLEALGRNGALIDADDALEVLDATLDRLTLALREMTA